MLIKYTTKNSQETQIVGEDFAKEILKNGQKKSATLLCLHGELGGGKTTFLQGFAKGLNLKEKILSPTFVMMKRFELQEKNVFKNFYHLDCYRMKDGKDAKELGLKEILKNKENIVALEWPEKIEKILPKKCMQINFKFLSEEVREIIFKI